MKTTTFDISPYLLCFSLMKDNRIETLLKIKQLNLLRYFCYHGERLNDEVWHAIRIALRHGYHWDDKQEISDWLDMIKDLEFLGLDTRNPHYICPANLDDAHQNWLTKANLKRFLDREKEKIAAYEPKFKAERERFFDMILKSDNITVQVIPTAMGIAEEGAHMCHCVGGYYNRSNSLILSARIDGKRMETVEVNLTHYTVVQSRGLQNKETPYHEQIVELVRLNMDEIFRRNRKAV